ncbi:NlpC/P60 family protein [Peribacillus loiseleuriae]|uniref:NlpC/P60 family protein n=1 Tax=Peribacillus loiseleuriae TaxID=1679170 RepID=UPI003D016D3E
MIKKSVLIKASTIVILTSPFMATNIKAESVAYTNQIKNVQDQRNKVQTSITNADSKIKLLEEQKNQITLQMKKLDLALTENATKLLEIENDISNKVSSIKDLQIEMESLLHSISKRREILKERAVSLQSSDVRFDYLDILFGASDFNDFFQRMSGILTIIESDQAILKSQRKDMKSMEELEQTIKETMKNLLHQRIEYKGALDVIQEQKNAESNLLNKIQEKKELIVNIKQNLLKEDAFLESQEQEITRNIQNFNSSIKPISNTYSGNGVPPEYMPYYLEGETRYGIPWHILAAVHRIETQFSTTKLESSAGAIGPMQFLPSTWNYYGIDADNNGTADPYSLHDSVITAAYYLNDHGFNKDPEKAIWHYNHSSKYVKDVLDFAENFSLPSAPLNSTNVVTVGYKWIGNSIYVFGGGRSQNDIDQGKFDCSSFVHWAFSQTKVFLGPLTSVSTETLKNEGIAVDYSEIQPGDLVFFDTYKVDGHVGIYVGDGKFLGAQSSTGVAIADMNSGYWKKKFNGRVNRIH